MTRRNDRSTAAGELSREDYDRLAIELAASLKLYLQLLELNPFSPDVAGLIRQIAREIVRQTPPREPSLH